ncbi:MAG: SDR family oxidoreductase [Roseibium sp.]|nr:SDR family oxidoreductase [Roseibium sp.]
MGGENPTALVTGATSRIGAVIAEDLAKAGWRVVLHTHRSVQQAQALQHDLETIGAAAVVIQADLTDPADLMALYDKAQTALGAPRLIVNNASIYEDDGIGSLDPALFDAHYHIHTRAPVFLTEAMAGRLPETETGLVVNIIDQRVWKLTPQALSYTLSKAALWTATQTLAQALAPRIRVNGIGPGPSFKNPRQTDAEFEKQTTSVPMGRGPAPEDFGRTIRFLWQTPSITGQMIALDGGQHLAWQTPDVTDVGE